MYLSGPADAAQKRHYLSGPAYEAQKRRIPSFVPVRNPA